LNQGDTCSSVWCNNIATEICPGCGGAKYCSDHMWKHGHTGRGLKSVSLVILIKRHGSIQDMQKATDYYDKAFIRIEQKLKTFASFRYITHIHGTNVIYLSTNLEREKLRSLVNRILRIREVDGLITSTNYIEELKDAMEMHDFFKVVAFSSTLLESYGKQILIKHYENENQDRKHNRIYNLSFNATAIMLYSSGIIDKSLFDKIDYVRRERNKFIHRASEPNLVLSMERVRNMEDLAHKAIHCVSKLMSKIR
jgi:hypothetical protein